MNPVRPLLWSCRFRSFLCPPRFFVFFYFPSMIPDCHCCPKKFTTRLAMYDCISGGACICGKVYKFAVTVVIFIHAFMPLIRFMAVWTSRQNDFSVFAHFSVSFLYSFSIILRIVSDMFLKPFIRFRYSSILRNSSDARMCILLSFMHT